MSLPMEKQQYYTYADYCAWNDGKRWEQIEGAAGDMAHAPTNDTSENKHVFAL